MEGRIGVAITVLLTLSTESAGAREHLPSVSYLKVFSQPFKAKRFLERSMTILCVRVVLYVKIVWKFRKFRVPERFSVFHNSKDLIEISKSFR